MTPPAPTLDDRFPEVAERLALFLRLRFGADAELDLVHETYLRARAGWDGFEDRGPASLLAWLCAIGRAAGTDALRRDARSPVRSASERSTFLGRLADAADPRTGPLTAAGRVELRARVAEAVAGLEPDERALLLERTFEGRTQAELAEAHGLSTSAVQRALARALTKVGRPLRDLGGASGA